MLPIELVVVSTESRLSPLHPAAATVALSFLLAGQSFGDAELSPFPEPIDFSGEVLGEHGGVKDQQGFVVLMGG